MEQMMAALMRQFQGQSASGGNNAPPAPIIPGNNNAPTTFPKPFTPSRYVDMYPTRLFVPLLYNYYWTLDIHDLFHAFR